MASSRTILRMTVQDFEEIRKDFVHKYIMWIQDEPSLTPEQMAEVLEYMADDFLHFRLLVTSETSLCFPKKCHAIRGIILELCQELQVHRRVTIAIRHIMIILKRAIGSLSLNGYSLKDRYAMDMARESAEAGPAWELHGLPRTKSTDELQVRLWTISLNLGVALSNCGCLQCLIVYPDPELYFLTPAWRRVEAGSG
ncbi:hypothetical protein N7462_007656 [Penicillium macrosclerotiorum]|uniref:uncharacterized protein n=1 Tax=Penicillium macrosclerotiorum TaxID=303699 RepID=UPI0025498995|nr:uncharacterized protein N7462_007656 [Penicillium macrosclerotiorum]KAJ5679412.1 hypothetical protein N7462_007656 [Penicillium macrosclerotiorum]